MNEKIKELARLSGAIADYCLDEDFVLKSEGNIEKFAQLIVRECCQLLTEEGNDWEEFARNPPTGQEHQVNNALFTAYRLKEDAVAILEEHFGIKS